MGIIGPGKSGKPLLVNKAQYRILKDNLDTFGDLAVYRAIEVMAYMGIDLLANSLPRVPWDTGELRQSGRVHVKVGNRVLTVAKGSKAGIARVKTSKLSMTSIGKGLRKKRVLKVFVSYHKIKDGKDIGIWTHEVLNPEESRPNPPAARKPGTGPKYLERAFNERKKLWGQIFSIAVTKGVEADLGKIANIVRTKKGKFEINLVKLVRSRVAKKGYFGRR